MPVTINGSGSITGLSVGGLGSGVVNTATIADGAVTGIKHGAGSVIQCVTDTTTARTDNNGNRVQDIKVPLAYGPRDKTIARLEQDPDIDREAAIVLPRMSFEMIGLSYATERKLNTVGRNVAEFLRLIDAYAHNQKFGEVCPANWEEGKDAMNANRDGVADYLASH